MVIIPRRRVRAPGQCERVGRARGGRAHSRQTHRRTQREGRRRRALLARARTAQHPQQVTHSYLHSLNCNCFA